MRQVVQHLISSNLINMRVSSGGLLHVIYVKVADAKISDCTRVFQLLKGFKRLDERHVAAPVQQVQIYVVSLQAPQTSFARLECSASCRVVRINFTDYKNFFTASI